MKFDVSLLAVSRFVVLCAVCLAFSSTNVAALVAQDAGFFYGIDRGTLIKIDPEQQSIQEIGSTGFTIGGLAYDGSTMTLFGIDSPSGQLLTIDPSSGQTQVVAATGFVGLLSLAYIPGDNALYSVITTSAGPDPLVKIDPSTGIGQIVGSTGFDGFGGLAYDPVADVLFGVGSSPTNFQEELVQIDRVSGNASSIGGIQRNNVDALTVGGVNGVLITNEVLLPDPLFGNLQSSLFTLNTETGVSAGSVEFPSRGISALTFASRAIPEPGAACVLMLGLTGSLLRRRR